MTADLDPAEVGAVLGDRAVHAYPAVLSTEADALAWARADRAHGITASGAAQELSQ